MPAVSLLVLTFLSACVPPRGVDKVAAPYSQETIRGHLEAMVGRIQLAVQNGPPARLPVEDEVSLVEEYFTLAGQVRRLRQEVGNVRSYGAETLAALRAQMYWAQGKHDRLKKQVEEIISRQVGEGISEAGVLVSMGPQGPDFFFPPSQFFLLQPPYVLVTSPRDRIEIDGSYLLSPKIETSAMDAIESEAETEGVSALVEKTGGFSLYPAWVSDDDTLGQTLNIVAHEWTHAYLFLFYPLGRAYFQDYELRTVNETVADMVGHEVGQAVYKRYYAAHEPPASTASTAVVRARETEFATQMRRIRKSVEGMLAQGRVTEAESFMESERQRLNDRGYSMRRLNQAYLALHGSYADRPAFEAPTGSILKDLRAKSTTLGEFIRRVGSVSSYADLERMVR